VNKLKMQNNAHLNKIVPNALSPNQINELNVFLNEEKL
jgi:hypothetical protein